MTTSTKKIHDYLSKSAIVELDTDIAKYPAEQRQSAVMRALSLVQDEHRYLTPEAMDAVADYLGMDAIAVYEVASFYSMYQLAPVGKQVIYVCNSISCALKNSDGIIQALEQKLNIKVGETTKDGLFTLKTAGCLGACVNAPAIHVGKHYYENVAVEGIDEFLNQCQAGVTHD